MAEMRLFVRQTLELMWLYPVLQLQITGKKKIIILDC